MNSCSDLCMQTQEIQVVLQSIEEEKRTQHRLWATAAPRNTIQSEEKVDLYMRVDNAMLSAAATAIEYQLLCLCLY